MTRLAVLLLCLPLTGCVLVPVGFTISYKDAAVGMTWQPRPSSGKNPISSK